MERSNEVIAKKEPHKHSYVPGVGYFRHDTELPYGGLPGACAPVKAAVHGSVHLLLPPGGKEPLSFTWLSGLWYRPGGFRLAFKAEYLGSHGWRYDRPVG
jgi:hypothetical protein